MAKSRPPFLLSHIVAQVWMSNISLWSEPPAEPRQGHEDNCLPIF